MDVSWLVDYTQVCRCLLLLCRVKALAVRLLHLWQDQVRAIHRHLATVPLRVVHQYWA